MPSAVEWLPRPQPTILRPWSRAVTQAISNSWLDHEAQQGSLWSLTQEPMCDDCSDSEPLISPIS